MIKKTYSGPLYIALAATLWSTSGLAVKYIPWMPLSLACARGVIAGITIALFRRKFTVKLTRSVVLSAICLAATTILYICANKLTNAANAIVFQNSAPAYVILLTMLSTRTKPRGVDIITVLLTLTGIAMFFIDHMGHGALFGDILALLSGVTFAGVFFFNSMPDGDPSGASYLGCCLSALLLPFLFFDNSLQTGGVLPWMIVIYLGVFQLGIGYFLFSKGSVSTDPLTASIICMIEPIFNPILVFLVMGERPGALSIMGAVVVLVTILLYNILTAKRIREEAAREQSPVAVEM